MNILMYTHNLDKKNGGMTFALKTRAEVLADNNFNIHVVTHGFSVNEQIEPKGYKLVNIYDAYSLKLGQIVEPEIIYFQNEVSYSDKNRKNCFRIFSNGEYRQYRQFNKDGELIGIDVFTTPWKRVKKYLFKNNKLVKIFYMDDSNKPKLVKYISPYNQCYITSVVDSNSWQDKTIYNHTNKEECSFYDFKFNFVKKYIEEYKIDTVFIDKREDLEFFLKLKSIFKDMKLIFVLHSNHYADYEKEEGIHPSLNPLFDNIEKFHRIIILTEEQKERIVKEIGYKNKFSVVSNIIDYNDLINETKTKKNLISMGRYESVKNMVEIIEVFNIVAKNIPDVKLDLYGYGKDKDKLLTLAKGKNIEIHDFIENPKDIMKNSSAFILTSLYEGQPLVLLECYDAQCPVFSYPIKFGAKDIIVNYENGIVLNKRDKKKMAKQIISYIKEEYSFKFEKKASEVFSKERYIKQLMAIIHEN